VRWGQVEVPQGHDQQKERWHTGVGHGWANDQSGAEGECPITGCLTWIKPSEGSGHVLRFDLSIEVVSTDMTTGDGGLAQGQVFGERFLRDLGGLVVANVLVQCRD
jgi:hypothetical protein